MRFVTLAFVAEYLGTDPTARHLAKYFRSPAGYQEGRDYLPKKYATEAKRLGQDAACQGGANLPARIAAYLDVSSAKSHFVAGCVAYYQNRKEHYTQEQCQCFADVGRAVVPDIYGRDFSTATIAEITRKNAWVSATVGLSCGLKTY
jgi:hypothetical protein